MREILFRGKHLKAYDKNESWVYGVPLINHKQECEMHLEHIIRLVQGETIGQYTGHTDKNGVKIFEGDIIKYKTPSCSVKYGVINFDKYAIHTDDPAYNIGFYISWLNNPFVRQDLGFWLEQREIVIIGNIHDNPELLKGDEKE